MCMSCGCKQPNENHGDQRNITMQDLQAAGQASDISPDQVVKNIQQGYEQFGASGQYAAGRTTGTGTSGGQQDFEQRQGGYGAGSSQGPQ